MAPKMATPVNNPHRCWVDGGLGWRGLLLGAPLAVFRVAPQELLENKVRDVVGGALYEPGVIVEQLTDGLFELEGAINDFGRFLDVWHFFLLWFPYCSGVLLEGRGQRCHASISAVSSRWSRTRRKRSASPRKQQFRSGVEVQSLSLTERPRRIERGLPSTHTNGQEVAETLQRKMFHARRTFF